MKKFCYIFYIIFFFAFCSCKKEEITIQENTVYNYIESTKDSLIQIKFSWEVNGQKDDGSIANMMLYVSPNKSEEDLSLDPSLENTYITLNSHAGSRILTPTKDIDFENLFAKRYYLGIAYNGLVDNNALPKNINISYTIEFKLLKNPATINSIKGEMNIPASAYQNSRIDYLYSMDISNATNFSYYFPTKHYIINRLPIIQTIHKPGCDIKQSNVFNGNNPLNIEMLWSVNGRPFGFKELDLDSYVIKTDGYNLYEESHSWSSNSYEQTQIVPIINNFIAPGETKFFLGFNTFDYADIKDGDKITCLYKITSLNNYLGVSSNAARPHNFPQIDACYLTTSFTWPRNVTDDIISLDIQVLPVGNQFVISKK